MQIELDFIDKIIEKYGSRKSLSAILGMWLISTMEIPETELWLKGIQIGGITALGVIAVLCQWHLDRPVNEKVE